MNDSIRAFFACFQSAYEPTDDTNYPRTTSIIGKIIRIRNFFLTSDYLMIGSSTNRANSPTSPYDLNINTSGTDGDEYCRITIDSLTNSYKIGSPVKPLSLNGKPTRSASHSLLTAPYMEGKGNRKKKDFFTAKKNSVQFFR
jgi:hypothetical protein